MHQNLVIIIEEKHIYSYTSELEMIICPRENISIE